MNSEFFLLQTMKWLIRKRSCKIILCLCFLTAMWIYVFSKFPYPFKTKIGDTTDSSDCTGRSIKDFQVRQKESFNYTSRLPDLTKISWPQMQWAKVPSGSRYRNGKIKPLPAAFEPVFSKGQIAIARRLLDVLMNLMISNGMAGHFMLSGGTLIGSFRHHDVIPWDDDIDILVDLKLRPKLQTLLQNLSPDYLVHILDIRDKFYTKLETGYNLKDDFILSRQTSRYAWGWPTIDICYYEKNDTHFSEIVDNHEGTFVHKSWKNEHIFPLHYRPFGKKWYPTPRDPLRYIHDIYNATSRCQQGAYSHLLNNRGPSGDVECHELGFKYAFVQHGYCECVTDDDVDKMIWSRETLIIKTNASNQKVIHSICIPTAKHNARADTYGLNYRNDQFGI